jgi:hypothetical protein
MRAIRNKSTICGAADARGRSSKKGIRQGVVDRVCAAAIEVAGIHVPTISPRSLMSLRMNELAAEQKFRLTEAKLKLEGAG